MSRKRRNYPAELKVCQGRSKIRPKGGGTLDHPAAGRSV